MVIALPIDRAQSTLSVLVEPLDAGAASVGVATIDISIAKIILTPIHSIASIAEMIEPDQIDVIVRVPSDPPFWCYACLMTITPPPDRFERARKRSVTIAGHETSIALEPVFWRALEVASAERGLPMNALIAEVDALRIVRPRPANLASALRTWAMTEATVMRLGRIIVDSANASQ